jgi:hypothetical protein
MEHYEIRVVPSSGSAKIYTSVYISDYAALRSARLLAQADERIEIWRGIHCIYQEKRESAA